MVQERLTNHGRIRALCDVETLQTVRMIAVTAEGGSAQIVFACLQLAPNGGDVDSIDGPPGRGVPAPVDPATGSVARAGAGGDDAHTELPDWPAACELAGRAAAALLPQRAIACDVALTPEGPVLIDANSRYGRVGGERFEEAVRRMRAVLAGVAPAPDGARA